MKNVTLMVWFQRVWFAILLAIAGGGPLPLWLHHLQCHCSSDGSHCGGGGQALHCSHHEHAHHAHASHEAAVHGAAVHEDAAATPDAGKRGISISRSASGEHGECAACYCLSQLSLSAPFQAVALSTGCVSLRTPTPDQIPEKDLLAAYSSRAPPAA